MNHAITFSPRRCLDPVSLSMAGTAVGVAGAVSSGIGGMRSGMYNAQVARTNATAQRQIADYNAKVSNINADTAEAQGNWMADRVREAGRRLTGTQKTYFGKYNLVGGSANDVIRDSSIHNELQAQADIYKGKVAANRYRNDAAMSTWRGQLAEVAGNQQAGLMRMGAQNAMMRGMFSAAGTMLSGGARAYSLFNDANPDEASIPTWGGGDEFDYPELIS